MTDNEKAVECNNKLLILGKEPIYLIIKDKVYLIIKDKVYLIIKDKVYLDIAKVTDKNLIVKDFVYGLMSTEYSDNKEGIWKNVYNRSYNNSLNRIEFGENIKEVMNGTFSNLINLNYISDLDKVESTDFDRMFSGCRSLTNVPKLSNRIKSLNHSFNSCVSLKCIDSLPSSCNEFFGTFNSCNSLIYAPDLPECTEQISGMFERCNKLERAPIIPSGVKYMVYTFYDCMCLKGTLEININIDEKENNSNKFLLKAATKNRLNLTGSCKFLDRILQTKSKESKISIAK